MKKRLLFIAPLVLDKSPRGIRIRNIATMLLDDFYVDVLYLEFKSSKDMTCEKLSSEIKLYSVAASAVSNFLNKKYSNDNLFERCKGILGRIFSKALNFLAFPDHYCFDNGKLVAKAFELSEKYNYDHIIGVAYPFTVYKVLLQLSNSCTSNLILDVGDPLSFNAALPNSSKNLQEKRKNLESKLLSKLNALIVTNEATKNEFYRIFRCDINYNIAVIPQGTTISNCSNYHKRKYNLGKVNFLYAGVFYPGLRDPYDFFIASQRLLDKISVDIYGAGDSYGKYIGSNIKVHKSITSVLLVEKYHQSDALIYFANKSGCQSSGKLYELLSCKKPILYIVGEKETFMEQEMAAYDFVFFCNNNKDSIFEAIELIVEKIHSNFEFSYNFDLDSISWENRAELYKHCLNELDS
ncbi:Uncharacterised protein [Shewanella baltica]|uniref:hypothetical protein n=1 Tax=Shewanella baltica TaxID=62322 RepID=UPI000F704C47|nr:hypothetical protein [Shewanella baltica]VEF25373.1 Uncharacterised protein [Shewanella baltica]